METTTGIELDGQYRALREGAGLVGRSGRRILRVSGTEAGDYLEGQLTNDVEGISAGEGCYAALLDRKGRMQGDLVVLRVAEGEYLLVTEEVAGDAVLRHLDMYRIGRDASVEEITAERAIVSLIGPGAAEVAGGGPLGPEHRHRQLELGEAACTAVATDLGLDLICPASALGDVRAALVDAGASEVDEAAAEIVRVESGRPRFGKEMTTATIPQEAGINERAVSFTKGCYIGQETVARLHYKGKPNRSLRGLRLDAPAADGDPVRLAERELGTVGTAVISPAHGPLALAILRREAEPGARVEVGDGSSAEVVDVPF
ncbi:MAG: YgfZ/GcvT domain-containing protein [Solirubrobacterales bacterium]